MTPSSGKPVKLRRPSPASPVVIVGAGLAGLFTALKLSPLPVTVIASSGFGQNSSSLWAQGGVAAAVGEGDTPESHAADTIAAGAGLCDPSVVSLLTQEAPDRIADLLSYGVPFERDRDGRFHLSQEAAHSARRIVRVNGDGAGAAIIKALVAAVACTPSVSVLENTDVVDLAVANGRVTGVYATSSNTGNRASFLPARAVVLASGGIGHLYRVTTNPASVSGAGLAMAARVGAVIADAEFMQFHPTAFDIGIDPAPLASESIRGDGAHLLDAMGGRFMVSLHPDAELAPRDVVARAVYRQIASGGGAYLDCRTLDLERRFPKAFATCLLAGIDPKETPIPIAPAAHYHMGGVFTDVRGRTTAAGLWACGEVACTAVHGANRLASNSLLEACVFGARVADDIASESPQWYAMGALDEAADAIRIVRENQDTVRQHESDLRAIMTEHVGVERSRASLEMAMAQIAALGESCRDYRFKAMTTAALFVTVAALDRRESRGAHSRSDFPDTASRAVHSFLNASRVHEAIAERKPNLRPLAPRRRRVA